MKNETKEQPAGHDFIAMEKKWLKHWVETGVIQKYLTKNKKSSKRFSFLDGPITANNPMGVHHGWGRTYKDLWQKFYNLQGYRQRFQNGFDCQGLWVEVEVEKELGLKSKKDIENLVPGDRTASIAKFVQLCRDRVLKFSSIQTEQSKRLGYFIDWDHSYFTMSDENNYMIWHFLKVCYNNGWIYKGTDSVPWCPRCETAISQHEMLTEDYKELTHETVFFKLPITSKGWDNTSLLVWTTTPWTIPANVSVGVNIDYTYGIWEDEATKERMIFIVKDETGTEPKRTYKKKEMGIVEYIQKHILPDKKVLKKVKEISGKELLGLVYVGPFDDLERVKEAQKENPKTFHTVVDGSEIVTAGEGTGLLHVAPGAGQEDFRLGKKENLPIISVIRDNADYLDKLGDFSGKNAKKHPEIIIDYLKQLGGGTYLLNTLHYTHRYPACWRCKTELVWKVAQEWYIAMDKPSQKAPAGKHDKRTLRERMMNVAKKIRWMPEFGLDRELDWLKNMHDWLISKKNRYWGLALPIYQCEKFNNFEVIGSKKELKDRAVKGWDKFEGHTPHKPYIDEVIINCSKCGEQVKRLNDVGNVWLDAGIVPYSTITENNQGEPLYLKNKEEWHKWFPVDFITESFPGQFKNWFYSMIAMSTVLEDTEPYKTVLGYATLLAEDGRPMHKSWGNSIEFNEGADKMGVDVMRWIYSRQNPAENMLFGFKKADEVRRQFYLILWNVYKFYLEYSHLDGIKEVDTKASLVNVLDVWLLQRFQSTVSTVESKLREYNSKDSAAAVEEFVNDLSTWYIRRSRNRVWIHSQDAKDKSSFYNSLYYILTQLSVILSPFLPFITEEIYTRLTGNESVHLSTWPDIPDGQQDEKVIIDMQFVRDVVEAGHRVRKELKMKVRQPLQKVTATVPKGKKFLLKKYEDQYLNLIKEELNSKNIELKEGIESIEVTYDTDLTPGLVLEGELRDLIRTIQAQRKEQGIKSDQKVKLQVPQRFKVFKDTILKSVLVSNIEYSDELRMEL